ncbi:MAG: RIP metalloprotease RseP [Phycisphaerae bacterium]|nr:RIP metalloprotease RseP [Phycisphaerae bacterium]
MLEGLTSAGPDAMLSGTLMIGSIFGTIQAVFLIAVGFSLVIFMHELGHFLVAKWMGVRVDRFAVGFGRELFGFTRGETRYSFNILPLGGYVKMLGQEDFTVNKAGEWMVKADPRAFSNKSVGRRMLVVSAGVFMNLVFAAVLFMCVFMIGFDFIAPVLGDPLPGAPAEQAGLQFGDRVLRVNGKEVRDYSDIQMAVVLAEPHTPILFKIDRDGEIIERQVTPAYEPDRNLLQIGVPPTLTRTIAFVNPEPGPPQPDGLKIGDEVIEADGKGVRDFLDVALRLQAAGGRPVPLVVNRPDPKDPTRTTRIECTYRSNLILASTDDGPNAARHLLGFVPRLRVSEVIPASPAELCGIRAGDIIAEWGTIESPTWPEIAASIEANVGLDIDVIVERDGERIHKYIRPKRSGMFGQGPVQIGLVNPNTQELDRVAVADIVDTVEGRPTPAAAMHSVMPRGSLITKVNDEPIQDWNDFAIALREHAGQEVAITWKHGSDEQTRPLHIPHCIGTLADLSPVTKILSINGKSSFRTTKPDGSPVVYDAQYWRGVYLLLKEAIEANPDAPVTIRYRNRLEPPGQITTKDIHITEETLDPWTSRMGYSITFLAAPVTTRVQTWNPAKAMWIGLGKTYDFVLQAYMTMKRMIFTRSVGVEHVSGPVGIFKIGMDVAQAGITKLMFFLGLISANLAVINFLPLPIVDGGLMVFLLIEKIRGTPVSMKTQMVTQIIGLALLIAAFVFVTIMDISKL